MGTHHYNDVATGLPAGTKLGRYEVLKHLARGGMADLSIARATGIENFERHVVIKHLRPEDSTDRSFVQMFVTEARLAGALHHHNIVQVYDIGQSEGRHFFAMEYVHGEDLRRLLAKHADQGGHIPIQHIVTIATAICAALHHAHEQKGPDRKPLGIVHRDVTPGNVIVSYDGNVKVVDFGIAKAALRTSDTATGMLKGKVPYMSPEQCTGKPVDRRSDVFALGIVLYELVTVRRLFKGKNEYYTMSAVVSGEIPKPTTHRKDLPIELEAIILKALSRKPEERFQSADEMRIALDQYADTANLRTSTTALADYMKKLFGDRPEPWMVDISPAVVAPVNFDKTDVGLVEISVEAVDAEAPKLAANGSLLDAARRQVKPIPSVVRGSRPSLPRPPRAADAEAVKIEPLVAVPDRASTDVEEIEEIPDDVTDITEPPVAPEPVVEKKAKGDSTLIVEPLPASSVGDSTDMTRDGSGNRKWMYLGGAVAVALVIAIVIMMTGRTDTPRVAATEPPKVEPEPPKVETKPIEPVVEPPKVETKPAEPLVEPPKVDEPKVDEPVVDPLPPKPKPIAKKPVVAKKPVAKPAPKPKTPQWDPNALFLKPKK